MSILLRRKGADLNTQLTALFPLTQAFLLIVFAHFIQLTSEITTDCKAQSPLQSKHIQLSFKSRHTITITVKMYD